MARIELIYAKADGMGEVWSSVDLDDLEAEHIARMRSRHAADPGRYPLVLNDTAGRNGPPSKPKRAHWYRWEPVEVPEPVEVLRRTAYLLERTNAASYRVQAYRRAAAAVEALGPAETAARAAAGTLTDVAHVGPKTAAVVEQALRGEVPAALAALEAEPAPADGLDEAARAMLAAMRGDCHTHSDWSDGGSPPAEMAAAARDLGHAWTVLTDHSPRLRVARGLTRERLEAQLDVVARINAELAPFRYLTGIEVDILDDGSLDQDDDLLARLDVVVASVHSKLRMPAEGMTRRMVVAIANPHVDVLGHCTGRLLTGRGRPESEFDAEIVIEACRRFDVALEVNARPERLDPPMAMLRMAVEADLLLAVDTDAHAPGQLEWQPYGAARAAAAGADASRVVTTWDVDALLAWTGRRRW